MGGRCRNPFILPTVFVSDITIQADKLVKTYAGVTAVNEVSFSVKKGEIVGFLGPNGAGKSTTMRILTGFVPATSGHATICGHCVATEPREVCRKIGYMPENNPLPEDMRVGEYLKLRAKLKGIPRSRIRSRLDAVMEQCDLARAHKRIIGALSKGYRQRVGIADAIVGEPDVIIMDEPTIGLDPHQIVLIRDLISSLRGKLSIILSSHILPEIEMTCDRVIIINSGRVVATGTPEELRGEFISKSSFEMQLRGSNTRLTSILQRIDGSLVLEHEGEEAEDGFRTVRLTGERGGDCAEHLLAALTSDSELRLRSFHLGKPTLEDVFMAATRRSWEVLMPVKRSPSSDNGQGPANGNGSGANRLAANGRKHS